MSNIPPGITIRHACLQYNEQYLFRDLDADIEANCFTSILGPSGVGKSSLLKLIAGLLPATQNLHPTDISATDKKPLISRIAYMAQQDALLPWCSILENVTLGYNLRLELTPDIKNKAIQLLNQVGLAKVANERPDKLSGGMRQRAALVRTLLEDRPIVLMDEPFSAVDAITRLQLQDLTAELLQQRTVLLITHDPLEALRISHRIHVMSGTPAQLDEALIPDADIPRKTSDISLLKLEAELFSRLTSAKAASI